MKIEGRNSVLECILAGSTIDRLAVAKNQKDVGAQKIIDAAKQRGIKITFLDKEALDRESEGKRHQGFIAMITDFKYCELQDILDVARQRDEEPLIVIADGIEDPHNLGSIIRCAETSGAHGIVIAKHRAVNVNETVIRVSAGASAHTKIARVTNINYAIEELKKQKIWVFAAETGGDSIYNSNLTGSIALVVGGEGSGISQNTRKLCDGVVTIPMYGQVNSLNASVACGIVLYEVRRQRAL